MRIGHFLLTSPTYGILPVLSKYLRHARCSSRHSDSAQTKDKVNVKETNKTEDKIVPGSMEKGRRKGRLELGEVFSAVARALQEGEL